MTIVIADLPIETVRPFPFLEIQGPPAKISKDEKGNWTVAAKKFAASQGESESGLFIKNTGKGSYAFVKKEIKAENGSTVLARIIPQSLAQISFPKNMRWPQAGDVSFARPIRWLCCLFGNEVVEFEFAGLKSSNKTYGHRFAHTEAITINHPDEYVQQLRDASVLVDREERKREIIHELSDKAKELGGEFVPNEELIEEVTDLVEYPKALDCHLGGFTDLPREVLETALAKHQRAFVVEKKGKLLPNFLVVTNAPKLDPALARPWFERMAISRLEDAEFFIKEDLEKGLEPLVEEESRVEWIKGIGTLADKTRWLKELGKTIAPPSGFDESTYERAAHLAKADLLTNLVREKEFTSLQGIAGAIYADKLGESKEVCEAIGNQYSDSPPTPEGAILGISDRLLNIAATFVSGKPPKGSSDPFALRRQATAVIKILMSHKIHLDIPKVIGKVFDLFGKKEKEPGQIVDFLRDRLELYLKDLGFAYDWVDAVTAVAGHDPYDAWLRLQAFGELHKADEFKLVAVGQKRVANITRELHDTPPPDSSLFGQPEEKKLWEEAERIRPELQSAVEYRDYKKALELLLSIRPSIDKFFDEVFVMVEDDKIRTNRLNLLAGVRDEFLKVADFSRIVVESSNS